MAPDCVGSVVEDKAKNIPHGGVLLLENLRFHQEEANDPSFAQALASLADVYVNDAFGSADRAHASTAALLQSRPALSAIGEKHAY
jgi:phosphoglycerate kinase